MAQPFNSLDDTTRSQMACTFAALLLHDDGSGVNVQSYWPMLFAQALNGKDIGSFLSVSSGSAPQQPTGGAQVQADAPKQEEKKEEAPEDDDEDMDIGDLFG